MNDSGHFSTCFIPIEYSQTTDFPSFLMSFLNKEQVLAGFLDASGGYFHPLATPFPAFLAR